MTGADAPHGASVWKLASRAMVLWIGAFLLMIGLVFTVLGIRDASRERRYQTNGRSADAIVTGKSIDRAERGGNPATRYLVTYRFTSSEGRDIEGSAEVPVEDWERAESGQTFPVTYLAEAPESSRAVGSGQEARIVIYVFLAIGGVFSLLGGGLTLVQGRDLVRAVRVLRHGLVTDGTVLRAGPTSTSINRVSQWRIHYRYRDHLEQVREGASHLVSPEEGSAWHEGDVGVVRYDRERPEISVWAGGR